MSINALQSAMLDMEQFKCPINHHFTDGLYCRELFIPKDVALVGAQHKTNHFFMLVSGKCSISKGSGSETITGPRLMQTIEGDKRAIHALEDSIIMTFHVTDEVDAVKIGEQILVPEQDILPQWAMIGGDA